MLARERRGELCNPAQVGDTSTLRIRVTFQLWVYNQLKIVDRSYRSGLLFRPSTFQCTLGFPRPAVEQQGFLRLRFMMPRNMILVTLLTRMKFRGSSQ